MSRATPTLRRLAIKTRNLSVTKLLSVSVFLPLMLLLSVQPTVSALSAGDVKSLLTDSTFYDPDSGGTCSSTTSASSASLNGADNAQKGFNYFKSNGFNDIQSAAIIGNFVWESGGMNPKSNQSGGPGMGIAQWSNPGRWTNLLKYANQSTPNRDPFDLGLQLDFVMLELQGKAPAGDYSHVVTDLKKQTTIEDATEHFMGTASSGGNINGYENPGTPHLAERIKAAKEVLAANGGADSGNVSGTNAPSCGTSGAVSCTGDTEATATDLSPVRQQVVCTAKAELALWKSGQLAPGPTKPYAFLKYSQGVDEEWCADFISWVYNRSGYPLGPSAKNWRVAAVDEVMNIGQRDRNFHYHPAGSYIPKPGDIIVHNQGGESHVNLVVSVNTNKTSMTVIGGNQSGEANYASRVTEYTDSSFSGIDNITGYVSPD